MITYIVPCYNSEKYIKETIDSIKTSKFNNFECIIINDGSSDNSESIINNSILGDKRFKLISLKENVGVGKARNIGIKNASNKYILPIDSDDIVMPNYAYDGINFLEANPEYSAYYGKVCYFNEDSEMIISNAYTTYQKMLLSDCLNVSGIYRKEKAIEIGGYNEQLELMEDYDFWIRYLYHNDKIKLSDDIGFKYRIHNDSRHNGNSKENIEKARIKIRMLNKYIYDEYFKF